jgi:hypothetical protein
MQIKKVVGQDWQIRNPLTQWRQIDRHSVDAEEEVQPKASIISLLSKVSIGCADKACIDSPRLLRSYTRKVAIL